MSLEPSPDLIWAPLRWRDRRATCTDGKVRSLLLSPIVEQYNNRTTLCNPTVQNTLVGRYFHSVSAAAFLFCRVCVFVFHPTIERFAVSAHLIWMHHCLQCTVWSLWSLHCVTGLLWSLHCDDLCDHCTVWLVYCDQCYHCTAMMRECTVMEGGRVWELDVQAESRGESNNNVPQNVNTALKK